MGVSVKSSVMLGSAGATTVLYICAISAARPIAARTTHADFLVLVVSVRLVNCTPSDTGCFAISHFPSWPHSLVIGANERGGWLIDRYIELLIFIEAGRISS